VRTADGYTEITPPRQQGAQNPKKTVVYYDDNDHPLDTVDLLGHNSRASYSRQEQLEWTEDRLDASTDYAYDPVTNALGSKTDADPDGAGPLARPVTSYRYDEQTIGTAATPGAALHGLHAAYFPNVNLSGRPTAEQTDAQVDFGWGTSGPQALNYRSDNFSVRWTGVLTLATEGDYTFSTVADGDTTLVVGQSKQVDGADEQTQLIDTTQHSPSEVTSQPIHLKPGGHTLTLEYTETTGSSEIHLRYACTTCSPAISNQVIPSAALTPNWQNRTTTVSPAGRVSFSHYSNPPSQQPDYTEQTLADGTKLITTFAYDDYGRPTRKVSPRGNATLSIDSSGNLGGTADTSYATAWAYYALTDTASPPPFCGSGTAVNQAGLLKQVTPPVTAATTYSYDAAGRTIAQSDGAGTTCTSYDGEGRKTAVKDANGHSTAYGYDPAGAVRTVTDALTHVTTTVYDESGAVIAKTDGNNHTTTYAHDAEGNQTTVADPLGHTTTTAYDELGRKTSVTDPLSDTTGYAYDDEGRLTTTTTPRGKSSTTGYDTLGRITAKTDPNNHTTSYGYDADGNQVSVTDPLGNVTSTAYDAVGRVASTTDANGKATTGNPNDGVTAYGYDLDGDQTTVTAADGGVSTTVYDPAGRKTSTTDPLNHTTTYAYDDVGRLVATTTPTGETTRSAYDPVGNVVSTTDPAGKTTSYTYDALNRPVTETTPLGETTATAYDNVGNKTSVTDPLGHATTYAYDAADRLTTTIVDPGSGHLPSPTTTPATS
jgi:YD repeat-containing protein